jgi:hypothetical protein
MAKTAILSGARKRQRTTPRLPDARLMAKTPPYRGRGTAKEGGSSS